MMALHTPTHLDQKWRAILLASQELIDAAEEARWTDLPLQAQYRDKLIREFFAKPLTVDNALQIQEQIKQILAMDEQVLGLARRGQEEARGILKGLHTGASAIRAYQN
ncbi:MAG: flagellar protein FliT [Pseudomonadales bacterium]|nr:flagellar protein FliT [Pseudomonadales bacterium]